MTGTDTPDPTTGAGTSGTSGASGTPGAPDGPAAPEPAVPEPAVPVTVAVADYWRGDFTLHPAPEEPAEPSLRRLGPSGITVRGRDLAVLLARAYDSFPG